MTDADLDALAPRPKHATLGGKRYKFPGDMPLDLFFRIQSFEERVAAGESEMVMVTELRDDVLGLFQIYQPAMKQLPVEMGVTTLLQAIGAIYGGGPGEAGPPSTRTRPSKKRTPSSSRTRPAGRATSR